MPPEPNPGVPCVKSGARRWKYQLYSGSYSTGFTELITVCVTIPRCFWYRSTQNIRVNFLVQVYAKLADQISDTHCTRGVPPYNFFFKQAGSNCTDNTGQCSHRFHKDASSYFV